MVLINNERGKIAFEKVCNMCETIVVKVEDYMQTPLVKPFDMPLGRTFFWKKYKRFPFKVIAMQFTEESPYRKFRKFVKNVLKRTLNR